MTRRSLRSDDSGAALILVLIVITVISVVVSALLSFSDTSIRSTLALRDQTADVYNADGAVQAAINNIRNSTYNASAGQNCFGGSNTMLYGTATVNCEADPTKVLIQCPSLSQCNRPGNAILTLGKIPGEDGINIKDQRSGGSTFKVHGVVFSNSNINVVQGTLNTNTAVYARGSCTPGAIVSTPAAQCNYGTTPNVLGDDPNYDPAATTVPAYRSLPACTTPDSLVTFLPGYYDDAVGLTAMMAGNSPCKNSTWWFKPGTYYFDFHNSGTNANSAVASGANVWTVNDGSLVAGTPINAAGTVIAAPPVPAAIPGSCDNPINDPTAVGVQFIFGNDSQFAVKAGQAEICGTYSVSKAPVAIYGLKSGGTETTVSNTSSATTFSAGSFTIPNAAAVANLEGTYAAGTFANWTTNSNGNGQTGQLQLGTFAPLNTIPAGSNVVSAKLRVGHRYQRQAGQGSTSESLSVLVTPSTGSPFTVTIPSYGGVLPASQSDTIDVTSQLRSVIHGGSSVAMTYKATVGQAGTESLDGVQLDVSYIAPTFRAGAGCVIAGPYTGTGSGSCALVSTDQTSSNRFYVQGTTYAPKAVLDVTLNNAAEQIFRFGVIARSLWVRVTGSVNYDGVFIEVPDDSPGFVFSVYLDVCLGSTTCVSPQVPDLRAKVAFIDADPTTPTAGQRVVNVLSWSRPR
jgi:hypothetical protein